MEGAEAAKNGTTIGLTGARLLAWSKALFILNKRAADGYVGAVNDAAVAVRTEIDPNHARPQSQQHRGDPQAF